MTFYARNLPHWRPPGQDIFITWRLYGSLPACLKIPKEEDSVGKKFRYYDRNLDAATTGPLWLKDPRVAESVIAALKRGHHQKMFREHAFAVMANHVHILIEPHSSLAQITKSIKGHNAHDANDILRRANAKFWQTESFDHWIRTPQEWQRIKNYILQNPVKAGLVQKPEDWPWSSASRPIE
jgi:REP element-mobilizing transposase RayT